MTTSRRTYLGVKERRQAALWLATSLASAPEVVREALSDVVAELTTENLPQGQFNAHWRQLGRALGILPSSERRRSGRSDCKQGLSDKGGAIVREGDNAGAYKRDLKSSLARSQRLVDKHSAKAREIEAMLSKLAQEEQSPAAESLLSEQQAELNALIAKPVEEWELSPEQEAGAERYADEFVDDVMLGDEADPAMQAEHEALMNANVVDAKDKKVPIEAPPLPEGVKDSDVIRTFTKSSTRYDFAMSVTRLELEVEKKLIKTANGTTQVIAGSTREYGPSRFSVTWGALATLATMVGQFAMPMNRLATMLSNPVRRFTASGLSRMMHYIGVRLFPIYVELFSQLADAPCFSGDDTSSRVVEVAKYFKTETQANTPSESPPWKAYATPTDAEATYKDSLEKRQAELQARAHGDRNTQRNKLEEPSLCVQIGRELTFESPRRDGNGSKRSFNTTLVTGRSIANDPSSLIVLYRSHLGSFGDLVEMLLRRRDGRLKNVLLQGDLSTTNLVTDPQLLKRFCIVIAGCSSHARRPFALNEDADPVYAPYMLDQFRQLALHERVLDQVGRNQVNVSTVRNKYSLPVWERIKEIAEKMQRKWPRGTPLGTAARYIIRHYEKLTVYLRDSRITPTNNMRERLLRLEKLIENGSMFRRSIEGRAVLDILRTVLQTAVAAGTPVHKYLVDILKADPEDITEHPERYTPHAWKQRQTGKADAAGKKSVDSPAT